MTQMVRFFPVLAAVFCLTIPPVYAEQEQEQIQMAMPTLTIDLSPVMSGIHQQQLQIWLALTLTGIMLALLLYFVLNRRTDSVGENQGDAQAQQVSLVWLMWLVVVVMGFALPALRFVLAAG